MLQDPLFANEVKCRWTTLRQSTLSDTALTTYIDSVAAMLSVPAARHFQKWPILGNYVWPNNFIGQSYQAEVNYLKTWVQNRTAWMDANMFGTCNVGLQETSQTSIQIFPNPNSGAIQITGLEGSGQLVILDLSAKIIKQQIYDSKSLTIDLEHLNSGIYFISEPTKGIYEKIIKQ
jgi:hypothetical protein